MQKTFYFTYGLHLVNSFLTKCKIRILLNTQYLLNNNIMQLINASKTSHTLVVWFS